MTPASTRILYYPWILVRTGATPWPLYAGEHLVVWSNRSYDEDHPRSGRLTLDPDPSRRARRGRSTGMNGERPKP